MENFNTMTLERLNEIARNRETVVVMTDQTTANTVGRPINTAFNMGIAIIPEEEIARAIGVTGMNPEDVRQRWIGFTLLLNHVDGFMTYTNLNDVDCRVEITFR